MVDLILKTLALSEALWHTAIMASRPTNELEHKPSETLLQNKRRMGSAKSKTKDIQDNGNGREPKPQADRPLREGKAKATGAAKSLSNRASDFDMVMGRVGRVVKSKAIKDNVMRHVDRKGQGRSDMRPSELHVPIARPQRLATEDGRTSFHFSHDSIAKTRNAVVSDSGRVNRPGAAKAHNKYIERDSAVAIDADGHDIVPANDTEIEAGIGADAGAQAINDNDASVELSKEPYFDRPLSRSFLRTYRAALGSLFADSDAAPGGPATDQVDGLQHLPGRGLVPDRRDAEMLLWADEVPVVGRDRAGDQGVRRSGDGDPQGGGRGDGRRLNPVPARLPRAPDANVEKAIEALGGRDAKADQSTPDGQGRYIERQEAMAIQPDGTRVLFTNIDHDADKRAEFWRLVEEHEREAEPDKMTFTIASDRSFWNAVAKHPKCPEKLSAAIAVADPAKRLTVETDDNVGMRRFLSTVDGWKDAGAKRRDESREDYNARRSESMCKFQDGRGGRVQYRIIGELPHELDVKARASILKTFSEEFEKRKLPFVSVMHAPDHTNNDKNWHFHLVYYDRPSRRLTAADVANVPVDENPKNKTVEHVSPMDVGRWDFTVTERYKTSSREIRTRYPFAQDKVKDVTRQDWVEKMRDRLSEITNDHLEKGGVRRRLDPRRHTEMGIHSNPQEHLGTKLANLEAMGIPTPRGVSNEERQWEAMQVKLDGDLERRKAVVDKQARLWLQRAGRATHLDDGAKAKVRDSVTRWHQHRTEAEEHTAIAENVTQHIDRTLSRAKKVRDTCQKQLEAIDAGSVTKFQASRAEQLQIKSAQAVDWLDMTATLLKDENKLAQDCRRTAQREALIADGIELVIERTLMPASVREVAAEEKRKEAESERLKKTQNDAAVQREEVEERRRALVKEDMDKWLNGLVDASRRLVRDGRRIVPTNMTEEDRSITSAINYNAMQARLAGMKRVQDGKIADVIKAVEREPGTVIQQRTDQGVSYVLVTSNRTLAKTFADFAGEPEIVAARDAAMARNVEDAARRAEDRRIAAAARTAGTTVEPATPSREPASTTREPVAERPIAATPSDAVAPAPRAVEPAARERAPRAEPPSVQPDDAAQARRAQVSERHAINDRIARAVRDEARRVVVTDGMATLSVRHIDAIGVTPQDIADVDLQKRLVALAKVQDREIKRLTAYARSQPKRLIERDGAIGLSAKSPPDLVQIANRWSGEDSVDLALRGIREESLQGGRQATLPVEPAARPQAPRPQPEAAPEPTRPEPQRPVVEAPAPAPSPEPVRPRLTELEPDYDLRVEAKAYAEEQERRRQQSASVDAAARPTREQRTGEDDLSRAVRIASEKAATAGAHPLIDRWIEAVRSGVPAEERRMLALEITTERSSREKLRDIDRQIARRIRDEADRAKEERQPGLGFDMDLGKGPRR